MKREDKKGGRDAPGYTSDETLLAWYNRGDRASLEVSVERYKTPLYNFLWRMTGCASDSDEIFQETWLRVIKKSKAFRHDHFKGWLFKIAHNLAIDQSRDRKKRVSLDCAAPGEKAGNSTWVDKVVARDLRPDIQVDGHDTGRAIMKALEGLPRKQRAVFLMRMESGMAFKDIAKVQKTSLNTVLSRMQYALDKMRTQLRDIRQEGTSML